jgi:hypothetical protein
MTAGNGLVMSSTAGNGNQRTHGVRGFLCYCWWAALGTWLAVMRLIAVAPWA